VVTPDGTVVHATPAALDIVSVDLEEIAETPFHRTPWYLQAAKASQAKLDEALSKQEPTARPLCVIGGTGFAPVKSLLDDIGKKGLKRPQPQEHLPALGCGALATVASQLPLFIPCSKTPRMLGLSPVFAAGWTPWIGRGASEDSTPGGGL
jgi:hypothetical protein